MIEFKKFDRVRNLIETDLVKIGELGTVTEDDDCPYVKWDNGKTTLRNEKEMELITKEQPVTQSDGAPKPNTIEWWRWHYAGIRMQAQRIESNRLWLPSDEMAKKAVQDADAIIAELQKKGGEQ